MRRLHPPRRLPPFCRRCRCGGAGHVTSACRFAGDIINRNKYWNNIHQSIIDNKIIIKNKNVKTGQVLVAMPPSPPAAACAAAARAPGMRHGSTPRCKTIAPPPTGEGAQSFCPPRAAAACAGCCCCYALPLPPADAACRCQSHIGCACWRAAAAVSCRFQEMVPTPDH